jgi:hypothetical protein
MHTLNKHYDDVHFSGKNLGKKGRVSFFERILKMINVLLQVIDSKNNKKRDRRVKKEGREEREKRKVKGHFTKYVTQLIYDVIVHEDILNDEQRLVIHQFLNQLIIVFLIEILLMLILVMGTHQFDDLVPFHP